MSERPGAFIAGCAGPSLTRDERAFFAEADPFGFILFARNVSDPDQLRRLTGKLREAVGRDAPILIDQEGGRVQRLGPPHWRAWAPAAEHVAVAGPHAERAMFLRARLIADALAAVGIDVNCAPVADIARPETHEILKDRCYGSDAASVTAAARATAEGLLAGGVLPVLKHIPGHGRATLDSHAALPRVPTDLATLQKTDFAPFRALADLPFAMTAHIVFDAIDPEHPITTSPEGIGFVRNRIGFEGFLMSDDISMRALSGAIAERAAACLRAGCDAVLHCNGDLAEMEAVAEACGELSVAAAARASRALARREAAAPAEIPALEAELDGIMERVGHG